MHVEEIHMVNEATFGDLVTYPTITTVVNRRADRPTRVNLRDGRSARVRFPTDGRSWLPPILSPGADNGRIRLNDICLRVSCGVATGADSVFIRKTSALSPELAPFAYPTISGRELLPGSEAFVPSSSILVPYSPSGRLLPEDRLGHLRKYLAAPETHARLLKRTCVLHKPWYAFHETPPLREILRPKLLCKDITARVHFWIDRTGAIAPRHSVYYIVPAAPHQLEELQQYLNSDLVRQWLHANCQRAANNFLRLQSKVLKELPLPESSLPCQPLHRNSGSAPSFLPSREQHVALRHVFPAALRSLRHAVRLRGNSARAEHSSSRVGPGISGPWGPKSRGVRAAFGR